MAETAAQGAVGAVRLIAVDELPAPDLIARDLGIAAGAPALVRRRLVLRDGQPVELADSWYPAELATGTPIALFAKAKGGTLALLAKQGHVAQRVIELVSSRCATNDEQILLNLDAKAPVLELIRVAHSSLRAIELTVMVTAGTERRLRYEMKVN